MTTGTRRRLRRISLASQAEALPLVKAASTRMPPGHVLVARLAEQAAAEGMSQQEWIRQTLRRTAGRLSPAELVAQRATTSPMSEGEFATVRRRAAKRRQTAVERLGAPRRRR